MHKSEGFVFLVRTELVVLWLPNRLFCIEVSKNRILTISNAKTIETWKLADFLQKLKKVVCIVLCGQAISQLDCRKACPYWLPYNNILYCCSFNQKQSSAINIHEAVNQLDIFSD